MIAMEGMISINFRMTGHYNNHDEKQAVSAMMVCFYLILPQEDRYFFQSPARAPVKTSHRHWKLFRGLISYQAAGHEVIFA